MEKIKKTLFFSLFIIFCLPSSAFAVVDGTHIMSLYDTIYNELTTSPYTERIVQISMQFFLALAGIQFMWSIMKLALEKNGLDGYDLLAAIFRAVFTIGLFKLVMSMGFKFMEILGTTFSKDLIGTDLDLQTLTNMVLQFAATPMDICLEHIKTLCVGDGSGSLVEVVVSSVKTMLDPFTWINLIILSLMSGVAQIIITIMGFSVIAVIMCAKVELILTEIFAVVAFAFVVTDYTRDFAISGIKAVVAVALKLAALQFLMVVYQHIGNTVVTIAGSLTTDWTDCYYLTSMMIGISYIFSKIFQTVPDRIAAMAYSIGGGYGAAAGSGIAKAGGRAALTKLVLK